MDNPTPQDNKKEAQLSLATKFTEKILSFITFSKIKAKFVVYGNTPYFEISMRAYVGDRPSEVFHRHGIQLKNDRTRSDGFIFIQDKLGRNIAVFKDEEFL